MFNFLENPEKKISLNHDGDSASHESNFYKSKKVFKSYNIKMPQFFQNLQGLGSKASITSTVSKHQRHHKAWNHGPAGSSASLFTFVTLPKICHRLATLLAGLNTSG